MKIVIVGGGTAGWMTAAMFVKHTTDYDITVIDSSKIGIIGAGEGSTGSLPWFIRHPWPDNSVNEIDFLRKTKGTIKLGINFKNWKGDGTNRYSPIHASETSSEFMDSTFLGAIARYGRGDYSSLHALLMEDKLGTFKKEGNRIVQGLGNHTYHFDGVEVGKYFKEWCIERGVKHIDSEVENIKFDENEFLKSIKLSDGQTIDGEFWFDCSGFNRVLMSKTNNKWISYKDNLITNTAITFSTDISSKNVRFETEATALDNGWMWKIPLQHRHGCGYVYCDGFTNETKTVDELQKHLGHKVEPIKTIKFESGRYEKIWYNNIVAVGLAGSFLEPLQATSIHISLTSVAQLLLHKLRGDTIYYKDADAYNEGINIIIDDYKDLVQMHYLTKRQDTPFWKFITNELKITDKNKEFIEISKHRLINALDVPVMYGTAGYPIWCHILENAGLYDKEMVLKELHKFGAYNKAMTEMDRLKLVHKRLKLEIVNNEEFFKYLKL